MSETSENLTDQVQQKEETGSEQQFVPVVRVNSEKPDSKDFYVSGWAHDLEIRHAVKCTVLDIRSPIERPRLIAFLGILYRLPAFLSIPPSMK
jgi:hypothetical protein